MSGTTISGAFSTGQTLSLAGQNPVLVTGSVNDTVAGDIALYGIGNLIGWTVTNQGVLYGAGAGVRLADRAAGTVTNTGSIGASLAVGYGVALTKGGSVVNRASGTVSAHSAVFVAGGAGTVVNYGQMVGETASGAGLLLTTAARVTNQSGGTITGYNSVHALAFTTVVNAGVMRSSAPVGFGLNLLGGGDVTNQAGGTMTGYGAVRASIPSTVINQGRIAGAAGGGFGVLLGGGGTITNLAGGTITGGTGARFLAQTSLAGATGGTVVNGGYLSGSGGTAISFIAGYNNRLVLRPEGTIVGVVNGGNTIGSTATSTLELGLVGGTASTAGTLNGFGSQFSNFGTIALTDQAQWTINGAIAAGTTLAFATGGSGVVALSNPLSMAGTISGVGLGDTLILSGIVSNAASAAVSGGILTVNQNGGPSVNLAFAPYQALVPTVVNTSNGQSLEYAYAPNNTPFETITTFSGPNRSGTRISLIVNNTGTANNTVTESVSGGSTVLRFGQSFYNTFGSSFLYAYNPTSTVSLTVSQYTAPNAGGTKVSDVVDNTNGTSLVYAYNPSASVRLTAQTWSATNPANGAPAGSQISNVVDNNDGSALLYQYNPSATVLLNVTRFPGNDPNNGAPTGTRISSIINLTDGTAIQYAYNPSSTISQIASFYSATSASGAPSGRLTKDVINYIAGFPAGASSVTIHNPDGSQSTIYYTGPDGTGNPVGGGGGALVAETAIVVSGSGETIDPGAGDHVIQFLPGAANDTLVVHKDWVSTISGFDPSAGDTISLRALLTEAKIDLGGDVSRLALYVSVTGLNGAALVKFDQFGQGGGSAVAVLSDGGPLVAQLATLKAFTI